MNRTIFVLNDQAARKFIPSEKEPFDAGRFIEMATAYFGPSRGWSGDSYKFTIFSNKDKNQLVIREINGAGEYWFLFNSFNGESLLNTVLNVPEPVRWDICKTLTSGIKEISDSQFSAGQLKVMQAFAEGRLKKKKNRGMNSYSVVIE